MKRRTVISVIVAIIILFLARSMYSDHNLKKIIGACILAQTQTSSIEEAKKICTDKFKQWKNYFFTFFLNEFWSNNSNNLLNWSVDISTT